MVAAGETRAGRDAVQRGLGKRAEGADPAAAGSQLARTPRASSSVASVNLIKELSSCCLTARRILGPTRTNVQCILLHVKSRGLYVGRSWNFEDHSDEPLQKRTHARQARRAGKAPAGAMAIAGAPIGAEAGEATVSSSEEPAASPSASAGPPTKAPFPWPQGML